jgi:penicillin-binding protein 1A
VQSPKRWLAIAGVTLLSLVAVGGVAIAIYTAWLFHDLPDAGDLVDYRPPTSTRAYAWDGTLIGEFSRERRIFIPYDTIPPHLALAFLAAEDRSFFKHKGVDPAGLARAIGRAVPSLIQGRRLQGGSTITQQVAKNVLLTNDVTLGRKFKEALIARRLEETLTKQQILELYLNEIWLGYRSFGVGAAAYNYFGKSISDISLSEAAFLAALPKGPDNYHPIRRKAQAITRRNWVLDQMAEAKWITAEAAARAKAEDLVVQAAPVRTRYRDADYFVEEVRRQGRAVLGDRLDSGGLYVRTTLDPEVQSHARRALMNGLEVYDRRHGWRGAFARTTYGPGWEAAAGGFRTPSERRDWEVAIVTEASGRGVRIETRKDAARGWLAPADVAWARGGKGLNVGDLIFVAPAAGGGFRLRQVPAVNGALVVVEPATGRVLALVGGYSFSLSSFNRATQARRQPGSTFKPFVYATALENGYTPASTVLDSPVTVAGRDGEAWSPENYSRSYYGAMQLRRGLELSRNTMTVRLAQGVGMKKVRDTAIRMGVVPRMQPVLAMALGAGETTPLAITSAYAAFVNGGRRVEPHLIELVQDPKGRTVLKADSRDCPRCDADFTGAESPRIAPGGEQVLDPITAYQVTSMLQGVVQRGTASAVSSLGRPIAGKTGTTNNYRSAWFIGYTPQMVVGVFVGFDDNRSLGEGESGTKAAVPIFIDFMRGAAKDLPRTDFKAPRNAKFVNINGVREAFRPGTEPKIVVTPSALTPEGLPAKPLSYEELNRRSGETQPAPVRRPDEMNGLY